MTYDVRNPDPVLGRGFSVCVSVEVGTWVSEVNSYPSVDISTRC